MNALINGRLAYVLILTCATFLINLNTLGNIYNGYERELNQTLQCIHNLHDLLIKDGISDKEKKKIKNKLKDLIEKKEYIEVYFSKTNSVIQILKEIDPQLFEEINSIKDKKGNPTDVYVKIVPYSENQSHSGLTNLEQSKLEDDVYSSAFGPKTVYVEVVDYPTRGTQRSISVFLLAHEFGHVRYQVPNLSEYLGFYKRTYNSVSESRGHSPNDPSGNSVTQVLRDFKEKYRNNKDRLFGKKLKCGGLSGY